ncbi:MAG: hypothetical protein KBD52_02995 [Candidatus Pacebacteria bacterium]|nr:hypothetical protein [Candidatus Paceibacterota bacterium]
MAEGDDEKLNNIEKLKGKLFSKSYSTKIEYRDSFSSNKKNLTPETWTEKSSNPSNVHKFFKNTSVFKKFFIFSVAFFVLSIAFVAFNFFGVGKNVSNDNIEISIFGNTFTDGGEDLPIQIQIINKNSTDLDLVDLVIEYPKSSVGDLTGGTERQRESLGTIPAGSSRSENVKVILFGEQGSVRPVRISIEYRVEGTNSIFVKEKMHEVTINTTPINISLDAPTEVTPNQDITLGIKASLNSTRSLENVLVKISYPVGFAFVSSVPEPSLGNNVWDLGKLKIGDEHDIYIKGRMLDVFDGEEKTFHIESGSQSSSDKSTLEIVYNSLAHTMLVQKPFIEAQLFVNGSYAKEYAINSKTPIQGQIRWKNNLNGVINDMVIRAKISGNALDRKGTNALQGFYSSSEDVIIWDKNSQDKFVEVNPGENGSVSFSLTSLPLFSVTGGILVEPSINIEVSVSGKQFLEGNLLKEVKSTDVKNIKLISDVGLLNKALHFSGIFNNTGPIPPKAEQETTYTVVWRISNTSNNLSKVEVRATLPELVRFTDKFFPESENVKYNSTTKELVWSVGNVYSNTGLGSQGREMSFQVAFKPSLSQVGTTPVIINGTTLTGFDDFAKVNIKVVKPALDTRLFTESTFPTNGDKVIE